MATSRDDSLHAPHQRKSVVPPVPDQMDIGLGVDFDTVLGKKLLRTGTGLSAWPVIVPIQFRCDCASYTVQRSQIVWISPVVVKGEYC
jgi:hypothetical protein